MGGGKKRTGERSHVLELLASDPPRRQVLVVLQGLQMQRGILSLLVLVVLLTVLALSLVLGPRMRVEG
jgi:hypothetical protein